MGNVRSYPSRELARLRRNWLRRNKKLVLAAVASFATSAAAATWVGLTLSSPITWYALGLVHAALVATVLHFINSAVLAHDPRAVFQLRGAWGEENTRSELEAAKKKRIIWGWIDSITLSVGDLDHVVVSREAGLIVLDSKFRTEMTAAGISAMAATANRARLRTEAMAATLLRPDKSGRHRARDQSVGVTTCIVLWGPVRHSVPDGHVIDGVHFIDGNNLRRWLAGLPPSPVSREAAKDLLKRLSEFRASTAAPRG